MALCLSGGGYRAALFHLGGLRRLNELGILPKITAISSVSGGSIVNALLATRLDPWPTAAMDPRFERFAKDLIELTSRNIRVIPSYRWVERHYRSLVGSQKLEELPESGPSFVFCATDMANGTNWTFARDLLDRTEPGRWEAGSRPAGFAPAGQLPLVRAVAASSAFPPILGPVSLPIESSAYEVPCGGINTSVRLTDGGVYDNLGLESVWKKAATVLVSDGGATLDTAPYSPWKPWQRFGRYLGIATSQGGSTRKRWLISSFNSNRADEHHYDGAYWGVGSVPSGYKNRHPSSYPDKLVDDVISEIRTDLDCFDQMESAVLQNHGYMICDAAVRTWSSRLIEGEAHPASPPFTEWLAPLEVEQALRKRKSQKRRLPLGRFR